MRLVLFIRGLVENSIVWVEKRLAALLVAGGRDARLRAFLWSMGTPALLRRIKCGDDGFHQVSFDVPQHSSTGDLHRVRTEALRVSYTGDNFAGMSSVLKKWLFRKMPNSRSCDEFSEHLQIVLFTLRDPDLYAVFNASADV